MADARHVYASHFDMLRGVRQRHDRCRAFHSIEKCLNELTPVPSPLSSHLQVYQRRLRRLRIRQDLRASVEITSRFSGTVKRLCYNVGDMAEVGKPLVDIDVEGDGAVEEVGEVLTEAPVVATVVTTPVMSAPPRDERVLSLATPAVRRVCKENGVDITAVKGTGKDGRVLKEDVLRFVAEGSTGERVEVIGEESSPASTLAYPVVPLAEDKTVPLTGIQKAMFKSMTRSLTIPHFGFSDEFILDATSEYRAQLNAHIARDPIRFPFTKISYMPIFIKSLSVALADYPIVNSQVLADDPSDVNTIKLRYRAAHNIGVAMDTPGGLVVPNIKYVQQKSVLDIACDLHRLQELGKRNAIPPADFKDGTVTLSNIGTVGGTYASPVVVTSEVAIAVLGKMMRVPRFEEVAGRQTDKVVGRWVMPVSWSADHRVIDGATIARFCQRWKALVEAPALLGAELK
ncbi:2-oxoacid dehydrogenases acyltransferase-domain-containing protein [Jimgerdemannia flammicorona]|uniref:dihydrolipoyllysine-residue (2-methylpropanoyl)transferase n=1 Tax=Jimgerdemannia flammicorona TaxID=994334 RepID=A0A433Q9Y0_9FUNG|nr:2-oxoacid dehydrogenases acyltransferase-domain-containing protein [Jimgerdemannia flammicorona]